MLELLLGIAPRIDWPGFENPTRLVCLVPGWIMAYVAARLASGFFSAVGFIEVDFAAELTRGAVRGKFGEAGCGWAVFGLMVSFGLILLLGALLA